MPPVHSKKQQADGRQAVSIMVDGEEHLIRVRKVSSAALPNKVAGHDVVDTNIQVQAYEVDANGNEIAVGPVIGETIMASNEDSSADLIQRLVTRALAHHESHVRSKAMREAVPDELI